MSATPLLDVDIRVRAGAFALHFSQRWSHTATAVCGASGAGKSLLIEALAGLRRPESGRIAFRGEALYERGRCAPPRHRGFGWVPQDLALWPHMTVRQHIDYAARRGDPRLRRRAVDLLELGDLLDRRPGRLSGGQQQRVALARAVAAGPRLLLLDEPLASLDFGLRMRTVEYIRRLERELGIPFVYVSHDRHELLALAEHVFLLQDGRVALSGPPAHVLGAARQARGMETGRFANRLTARIESVNREAGTATAVAPGGLHVILPLADLRTGGGEVELGIDPADVIVATEAPRGISAQNVIAGVVGSCSTSGGHAEVVVRHAGGTVLRALLTAQAVLQLGITAGARVHLIFKAHAVHVL